MWLVLVLAAAAVGTRQGLAVNGAVFLQYDVNSSASESLRDLSSVVGRGGWVSFVVSYGQPSIASTAMAPDANTLSASHLTALVQQAQRLGLHTAFKPHVDLTADPTHWRGQIGRNFSSAEWDEWFASYQAVVLEPLAALAQQLRVDVFIAGTELTVTQPQESRWRGALARVRSAYSGLLTYGANHDDEASVGWWDAVDWIGVDAYYALGKNGSVAALMGSWRHIAGTILAPLSAKFGKPIFFPEIGYEALSETFVTPWQANGTLSPLTQSDCYLALYQALSHESWFLGPMWWAFTDAPEDGGAMQPGFSFHNKPAAAIISWQGAFK